MDTSTQITVKIERILIETDELIFPIKIEQILYAEITNSHFMQFYGLTSEYQVDGCKNDVITLLEKAGFIRIQSSLYINPKQISEYKIKDQLVELSSGKSIPIQLKFKNSLLNYFRRYNV